MLERDITVCCGRSHNFKPTSLRLISEIGANSKILDIGGGDRKLDLPNYVNIDIIKYPSMTTILGDGHFLPFESNCFDIILCEAVIEHCKKPWIVANELYRVLRKDGLIYIDAAFMQPVHSYPNHYFNMTLNGVETLFEKFEKIDSGVQTYQMPSFTLLFVLTNYIRCLFPFVDKYASNIQIFDSGTFIKNRKKSSIFTRIYQLIQSILVVLDRRVPPEKAQGMAAGVYFIGRKG